MSRPSLTSTIVEPASSTSRWKDYLRYRELLGHLVLTELKVKYRGSALGFMWSLLSPLALIVIYTVAFRYIIKIQLEHFTEFLISGLLPWTFFANSALSSTVALIVIYTVAFRYIIKIQLEHFTAFLISGLLPWTFFANSALSSTVALMANANLLKKV